MNRLKATVLMATVAGAAFSVAAPASAAAPVPAGCTFAQGQLTCVTTTTDTAWEGPFLLPGAPESTPTAGFTGQQICDFIIGSGLTVRYYSLTNISFSVRTTTTTTTTSHGVSGKSPIVSSDSTSERTLVGSGGGTASCTY